jgi:C1A family cysteine protease
MEKTAQVSTAAYPYTSGKNGITGSCNVPADSGVAMVSSYVKVGTTNEDIMAAIDLKPVSVAVDAMFPAFQFYTSGVVTQNCGHLLDHAIMAVGYGTDPVYGAYFLCRNSWGSSWGDQGYLKIGQSTTGDAPGICGINSEVYYVNAYTV